MVTAGSPRRAERAGARFKAHRSGNDIAEGRLAGVPVTLAWPRSYMNLSGRPVAALAAFYKIPPERLVVSMTSWTSRSARCG
jgi:PTH1 family peptidyl-tRNA hydrolase